MGRIMAIDFGTKRIGIAVTDPLKMIANGLGTVTAENSMTFLEEYMRKEAVECVVIGKPNSDGRGGDLSKLADDFCFKMKKKFPSLKIARIDEF